MKEIPLTKRSRAERMVIVCSLLSGILKEIKTCEAEDIESGLLKNAVHAQVDMNRIVWKLNELNGAFGKQADTPQTDCGWGEPNE